jgi:hypothetical protein
MNTEDRELLELAAKAAGIEVLGVNDSGIITYPPKGTMTFIDYTFNPLTDDGDAFRLMVVLDIEVYQGDDDGPCVFAGYWAKAERRDVTRMYCIQPINTDRIAATRRAITRAAAEIGRRMA